VDAIAAPYPDRDSSWRIIPFTIIFALSHDENAIATNTKAGKRTLALLTYIAVNRHEVFRAIHEHYTRLRINVRKQTRDKFGKITRKRGRVFCITPCRPVVLFSKGKPP
jgi:hypothetical protein